MVRLLREVRAGQQGEGARDARWQAEGFRRRGAAVRSADVRLPHRPPPGFNPRCPIRSSIRRSSSPSRSTATTTSATRTASRAGCRAWSSPRSRRSSARYFGTDKGVLVVRAPENDVFKLQDGDVILSDRRARADNGSHVTRILRSYQPGEKLTMRVMRDRKPLDIEVTLPESRSRRTRAAQRLSDHALTAAHAAAGQSAGRRRDAFALPCARAPRRLRLRPSRRTDRPDAARRALGEPPARARRQHRRSDAIATFRDLPDAARARRSAGVQRHARGRRAARGLQAFGRARRDLPRAARSKRAAARSCSCARARPIREELEIATEGGSVRVVAQARRFVGSRVAGAGAGVFRAMGRCAAAAVHSPYAGRSGSRAVSEYLRASTPARLPRPPPACISMRR